MRDFQRSIRALTISTIGSLAAAVSAAQAQNTSGVFSPTVRAGDFSAQYRLGVGEEAWSHRVHMQRALSDQLRLRGVVQYRSPEEGDHEFDYVQGEVLWELPTRSDAWSTAFRFDGRIRDGGRPEMLRAIWANDLDITDRVSVRGHVLLSRDFGDAADDDVFLETRARVALRMSPVTRIGIDSFNDWDALGEDVPFDEGDHQIGPFVDHRLNEDWSIFAGALFGASEEATDTDLRFWINRRF